MSNNDLKKNIIHGTAVIFSVTVIAKIIGFLTSSVLAYYLGTSEKSDAYYTVLSVDQVFYPMLGVGIWNVFLPLYKEKMVVDGQSAADRFSSRALTFFSVISISLIIVLILLAEGVVQLLAPGFSDGVKQLAARLIRISAPMYFFTISAAIMAAMLQCHNNFLGSQIREVVVNIPVILAAVFLYRRFGIESLAAALIAGGALRLLAAMPFVNWGYRFRPDFRFRDPDMRKLIRRFPSAMLSQGVNQLNMLADKIMASSLTVGAVSALNYGNKLLNVLNGLLSTSVTTAVYPQVVELLARKERDKLGKLLSEIVNLFLFLMVPITVFCLLFSGTIVKVVYQRGAFDRISGVMTSGVFAFYCLELFFLACNTLFQNVFYAGGDTRTPLVYSMINLGSNIVLNLIFIRIFGIAGLALATSVSAAAAFVFLVLRMRGVVKLKMRDSLRTAFLSGILSAAAAAGAVPAAGLMPDNKYILLLTAAAVFFGIYLLAARLLRVRELGMAAGIVKRKRKR